jgi:hypothetical protein
MKKNETPCSPDGSVAGAQPLERRTFLKTGGLVAGGPGGHALQPGRQGPRLHHLHLR